MKYTEKSNTHIALTSNRMNLMLLALKFMHLQKTTERKGGGGT